MRKLKLMDNELENNKLTGRCITKVKISKLKEIDSHQLKIEENNLNFDLNQLNQLKSSSREIQNNSSTKLLERKKLEEILNFKKEKKNKKKESSLLDNNNNNNLDTYLQLNQQLNEYYDLIDGIEFKNKFNLLFQMLNKLKLNSSTIEQINKYSQTTNYYSNSKEKKKKSSISSLDDVVDENNTSIRNNNNNKELLKKNIYSSNSLDKKLFSWVEEGGLNEKK